MPMLKEKLRIIETALKELADINYALDEALIVAITDQKGIITFANSKFCEISKYSREELLGQNHRIINSHYHPVEFFREMWRTIANGRVWRGEIRNQAKDGSYYWMDTTIVPCLNAQGKPYQYVSFRIDITRRKQAEEFLRRSEKISAVGQMASGIAHEIRNPLAAIKWSLQLLKQDQPQQSPQFDMILSELDRVDGIVEEFMALAKPQVANFHTQRIESLLETTVALMNIQAKRSKIKVLLDCAPDVPYIRCDENQMKQVVINIIKNSIEAMPSGGEIRVEVRAEIPDKVRIRFTDEGCGISDESLPRLGEPFYTTKEKGTGLGLMVCHKIVEDHSGQMSIRSTINVGTVIDILLPAASESTILA